MTPLERLRHKGAYKFAAATVWKANDLLNRPRERDTTERCLKARQQAGRVLAAVGTDRLRDMMRRYDADLTDFDEDFPA